MNSDVSYSWTCFRGPADDMLRKLLVFYSSFVFFKKQNELLVLPMMCLIVMNQVKIYEILLFVGKTIEYW